ncbi:UDP-N-acetylmuramoyl-tripeptide--D-alanyl-D-alanine ligase [Jatrophihabitans sp. YIM 134969]
MIATTLAAVATAVGGTLGGGANPEAVVTAPVVFDSRTAVPGGLFVAFDGEHTDGHAHVADALARGAVAAIVTRPVAEPHVLVADAATAMGDLARDVASRFPATLTVIGITGSSGKTSTKDLVAQLLAGIGPTVAPPGSFNNELGHPYTVLLADADTRFLVLETSARGIGHIAYLTGIARPRIGVELNVGTAHLGEFGSRAAIAQAKGELVEALPAATDGGVAVLNADDPLVRSMASRTTARVVLVGEAPDAHVRAVDVSSDHSGRATFTLMHAGESSPVRMRLVGGHHVGNALAAAAVALECGMSLDAVAAGLSAAGPVSRWRMEVTDRADGVTVVNDAYNANPDSVKAALKTLAEIRRGGADAGGRRAWAVLGPMNELGDASRDEHDAIGRLAVRLSVDKLVAVGADARPMFTGASLEGSWDGEAVWEPDVDTTIALLREQVAPGDVVLVKASRSAGLERVAAALLEGPPARHASAGEAGA